MAHVLNNYQLVYLGYSTVRDYTRYYEQDPALVGPKGDLKDVQRPWALEAIREHIPNKAKLIDMGGGYCELAAVLMNDYAVTVIDPYDDRGGGPSNFAHFPRKYPRLSFIRDELNSHTQVAPEYQAVVSTSVFEHIPPTQVFDTLLGIDKALLAGGYSIHAVDFTVSGESRFKKVGHQIIQCFLDGYGLETRVEDLSQKMLSDPETYYLSPLMYQQWRKERSYDEYPWRLVGTVNVILEKTF